MAGDHKCPVCQSTFTRPQHVARHMRSHTGDRPYKCTICGDQFARSDLLSRHVNKCHAADRPQTTSSRRRGSNTAAAAQARLQQHQQQQQQQHQQQLQQEQEQQASVRQCDQCAHAGLGCDLRSPCTTCAQRKIPCSYPRARPLRKSDPLLPAAAGLFPPPASAATGAPGLTLPSMLPGEALFPSGGGLSYPSHLFIPPAQAADLATRQPSLFPPVQTSLGALDLPLQMYSSPTGSQLGSAGTSLPPLPLPPPSSSTAQGGAGGGGLWQSNPATGLPADLHSLQHAPRSGASDFMSGYESYPDSRPSTGSLPSPRSLIDMAQPAPVDVFGYRRGHSHSHSQSDSGTHSDFSTSSSPALGNGRSGTGTYSSQLQHGPHDLLNLGHDVFPHPPPAAAVSQQQQPQQQQQQQTSSSSGPGEHYMLGNGLQLPLPRNDGQFSNAFGLLSLEELRHQANASASSSGQLFAQDRGSSSDLSSWSRPGSASQSHASPDRPGSSHDPGRENRASTSTVPSTDMLSPASEARQIKEFWKAFMVDPYASGQTPEGETPGILRTPHASASARPGYLRTHSLAKSTSLPPIRRAPGPSAAAAPYDDSTPLASMAQQLGHAHNPAAPPRVGDDLRSYEAAIRARPPPVLRFEPRPRAATGEFGRPYTPDGARLRGGAGAGAGAPVGSASSAAASTSGGDTGAVSDDGGAVSDPYPIPALARTNGSPSVRRLATLAGTSAAAAHAQYSSDESSRPSFKRLASQTLGPSYAKRAAHTRLGGGGAGGADSPGASITDGDGDDEKSTRGDEDRDSEDDFPRGRATRQDAAVVLDAARRAAVS